MNYNNRQFTTMSSEGTGEVDARTIFNYFQTGSVVWGTYTGGEIRFGTITGIVSEDGIIEFAYQHVNQHNEIRTGRCISTPELMEDGRIRLHEKWRWTTGDQSAGESVIEEIVG